jgi:hypothetical protein
MPVPASPRPAKEASSGSECANSDHHDDHEKPSQPVNEYEDAEKNFQPKSIKFWTVMIAIYLSILLVGLVSGQPPIVTR